MRSRIGLLLMAAATLFSSTIAQATEPAGIESNVLLAQGRTLVISTHDEEFARHFATRIIRMADGIVAGENA